MISLISDFKKKKSDGNIFDHFQVQPPTEATKPICDLSQSSSLCTGNDPVNTVENADISHLLQCHDVTVVGEQLLYNSPESTLKYTKQHCVDEKHINPYSSEDLSSVAGSTKIAISISPHCQVQSKLCSLDDIIASVYNDETHEVEISRNKHTVVRDVVPLSTAVKHNFPLKQMTLSKPVCEFCSKVDASKEMIRFCLEHSTKTAGGYATVGPMSFRNLVA